MKIFGGFFDIILKFGENCQSLAEAVRATTAHSCTKNSAWLWSFL